MPQRWSTGTPKTISLRGRLLVLLLTTVLPFIGFSVWKALDINEDRIEETRLEGLLMARTVAFSLDDYVVSSEELLVSLAKSDVARSGDLDGMTRWFTTVLADYPHYSNIIFVDSSGFIRAAGKQSQESTGPIDVSDTVYYQRSMESTGLAVGDFMRGKISGAPVVHLCYPVLDATGARTGFIAVAMHLERVQERIMHEGIPEHMIVNVIDQNGVMVARNLDPDDWVGRDVYEMLRVDRIESSTDGEGSDELFLPDGTTKICSFTSTSELPWFVRCGTDETYVQEQVRADLIDHWSVFLPLILFVFLGWTWIGRDLDRLHRHTQNLARSDGLTGLWNTRQLEDDMRRSLAMSLRSGDPVSFIMLDIDHFKRFNDRYGHQAGDEALRTAAALLTSAIREGDTCYRYGGEEFCVLLPATSPGDALAVAERIREVAEGARFQTLDSAVERLTISGGVATYPINAQTGEELILCADRALYRAKSLGRNRVEVCQQSVEPLIPAE